MKVVVLGKGEMLANLIEGVIDGGGRVVGVFRYERTVFSALRLAIHDFFKSAQDVTVIKEKKLYEIKCKSANSEEFKKEILKLNADIILVGSWREKLKKEIIDLPVIGTVNVHPSLLPAYRGPNPYLQTILHNEKKSGVTFHLMTEDFDKGPILLQKEIEILSCDTGKELKAKTVYLARALAAELVRVLGKEVIIPIEQNEKRASYFPNVKSSDMTLDFENKTAQEIHSQIRAFHPWLPSYIQYKNVFFKVNPYKACILENAKGKPGQIVNKNSKKASLTIICRDGNAVQMNELKLYGFFKAPFTKFYIEHFI